MSISTRRIVVWCGSLALLVVGVLLVLRFVPVCRSQPAGEPGRAGPLVSTPHNAKPPRPITPRHVPLPPLGRPRIIVEKSARRLTVCDGDRAVKTYLAAIGGGRGDKVREGDRCTPEGDFYICVKNPNSRFTLSLALSYPNIEDAARGLRDGLISRAQHDSIVRAIRRGGVPPWKTPLGGEIMIHGGGAGRDWTLGCIALHDSDIRELFAVLPLGTPVQIRP